MSLAIKLYCSCIIGGVPAQYPDKTLWHDCIATPSMIIWTGSFIPVFSPKIISISKVLFQRGPLSGYSLFPNNDVLIAPTTSFPFIDGSCVKYEFKSVIKEPSILFNRSNK